MKTKTYFVQYKYLLFVTHHCQMKQYFLVLITITLFGCNSFIHFVTQVQAEHQNGEKKRVIEVTLNMVDIVVGARRAAGLSVGTLTNNNTSLALTENDGKESKHPASERYSEEKALLTSGARRQEVRYPLVTTKVCWTRYFITIFRCPVLAGWVYVGADTDSSL